MKYLSIIKASCVDFTCWSVVLQVSGCSHMCEGCFNPSSWKYSNGEDFTEETYGELLSYLNKPYINNIVLQGGDPLFMKNVNGVIDLCKRVKSELPEKNIVVFTGYTFEQILSDPERCKVLSYIDVLVDGKYDKSLPPAPFRGSSNQRIIDVQKSLAQGEVVLYDV